MSTSFFSSSSMNFPTKQPVKQQPHTHVVLFYRYFLPTTCISNAPSKSTEDSSTAAMDAATLQFFKAHEHHYLPLLQTHQNALCQKLGMKGRILLSAEGINGTLSCHEDELKQYRHEMENFDVLREFHLPDNLSKDEVVPAAGNGALFCNIDWKTSTVNYNRVEESTQPFPDLKVQIVKEIVNTGGTIDAADIPEHMGKEISPEEFHNILMSAKDNGGCAESNSEKKEVVLIDVRNTFEHAIGHFVHPHSKDITSDGIKDMGMSSVAIEEPIPAINPNTVTFSHFDSNFCSKYSDILRDKKVLMYCTGGIRCVKASAMLKRRGVEDVSHLSGGIHRYLEKYANEGFYKGKCMVFDQRVALDPVSLKTGNGGDKLSDIVGKCIECQIPYDQLSGANLCTVCRDLILICPKCHESKHEYHCDRHRGWKDAYFTFLDGFTIEELQQQKVSLLQLHHSYIPPKEYKNVRRTLRKQIDKVQDRINELKAGSAQVQTNADRRCRTCFEVNDICDGLCWGFWKHAQSANQQDTNQLMPIHEVKVGDRVQPGPDWNEFRYGSRFNSVTSNAKRSKFDAQSTIRIQSNDATLKAGTVVQIKSWDSGDDKDCLSVVWDDSPAVGCSRRKKRRCQDKNDDTAVSQVSIYRWGTVARNGKRMYDVELIPLN